MSALDIDPISEALASGPITHELLARLAEQYAAAVRERREAVHSLRSHIAQIAASYRERIGAHAENERFMRDVLVQAVEMAPDLFERPRTRKVAGVEYGYRTGKPAIQIADEARTISLIRKLLPEGQQVLLIRTRESVHKPAVLDLTAADLRRLGITQTDPEDSVVVRAIDDDTDRLIDALLADTVEAATEDQS